MSVNPHDFYDLAVQIAENHSIEINRRTAINRAYYAVHLKAKLFCEYEIRLFQNLETIQHDFNRAKRIGIYRNLASHEKIIYSFQLCPQNIENWQLIRQIGYKIANLKTKRHQADYDINLSINEHDSKNALIVAKQILNDLNSILTL